MLSALKRARENTRPTQYVSYALGDSLDMRLLIHYVGDIHQPLHASSRFTAEFPNGDRGGNSYHLKPNGEINELHALWDSVLQEFSVDLSLVRFPLLLNNKFSPLTPLTGTSLDKMLRILLKNTPRAQSKTYTPTTEPGGKKVLTSQRLSYTRTSPRTAFLLMPTLLKVDSLPKSRSLRVATDLLTSSRSCGAARESPKISSRKLPSFNELLNNLANESIELPVNCLLYN